VLDRLALEKIMVDCSEVGVTINTRTYQGREVTFKWSIPHGVWACNALGYGTARIHPGEGEWKWRMSISLDKGSGHLDSFVNSNSLQNLMTHFEDEAIRSKAI
jgi:hypothetical protein